MTTATPQTAAVLEPETRKFVDSLAAAGWLKLGAASIAKLALGITSHEGPDGKRSVDTPISIQNRRISAGAIKLGQMPEMKLY